jgi:hypothetical protein
MWWHRLCLISLLVVLQSEGIHGQMVALLQLPQDLQQALHGVTRFAQAPFREPTMAIDRASFVFQQTMKDVSRQFSVTANDTSDKISQNVDRSLLTARQLMDVAAWVAHDSLSRMENMAPTVGTNAATSIIESNELWLMIIAIFLLGSGIWLLTIITCFKCLGIQCTTVKQLCQTKLPQPGLPIHLAPKPATPKHVAQPPSEMVQSTVETQSELPSEVMISVSESPPPPPSIAPSIASSIASSIALSDVQLFEIHVDK